MNKLLKVTLITAIMATSGMAGEDFTRGSQSPVQNQCCEMMTKGALCAAAGYVAYKLYWDTSVDGNTGSLESITKEVADIKSGLATLNDNVTHLNAMETITIPYGKLDLNGKTPSMLYRDNNNVLKLEFTEATAKKLNGEVGIYYPYGGNGTLNTGDNVTFHKINLFNNESIKIDGFSRIAFSVVGIPQSYDSINNLTVNPTAITDNCLISKQWPPKEVNAF